jgi:hypothetical protein
MALIGTGSLGTTRPRRNRRRSGSRAIGLNSPVAAGSGLPGAGQAEPPQSQRIEGALSTGPALAAGLFLARRAATPWAAAHRLEPACIERRGFVAHRANGLSLRRRSANHSASCPFLLYRDQATESKPYASPESDTERDATTPEQPRSRGALRASSRFSDSAERLLMSARDLRIRDEVLYANRHAAINFISRKIGATISIIGSE